MVATSHPLAAEAGLEALRAGGTAADAAVAAVAVLCVVDPRSTGIGGDAFAQYWPAGAGAPTGLAAAGFAPRGLTAEALRGAGFDEMPSAGPWTVTVPGSVAGWQELLGRYGKLGLDRALAPAVELARSGFEVTPIVAEEWAEHASRISEGAAEDVYLPGGRAPAAGDGFRNPQLGEVLARIGTEGSDAFYRGPIASRIADAVQGAGGPLTTEDLSAWPGPEWIDPLRTSFRGLEVFELPPPGQGLAVLSTLRIYEGMELEDPADRVHASIEAMKLAFADARAYIGDPHAEAVPVEVLLDDGYVSERRRLVSLDRALEASPGRVGDTVYVATLDADGNACSFIQSLYDGFGSGVGVPGTGIVLQNRGAGFVLDDDHPNRPAPRKRPYHTIIPAMLGREGSLAGVLGVVGGFMQPQGQFQIIRALVEEGDDPVEAVSRPRFRILGGLDVGLEASFDRDLAADLERRGHRVRELSRFGAGGAQLLLRSERGWLGASDPRKDGVVGAA